VDSVVLVVVVVVVVELVLKLSRDRAGAMTDVASDVATAEPFLFVAVTVTRSVNRTSEAVARYCCCVAEPTGAQAEPRLSQRIHWKP
jgi:hypothetical protein